MAAAMLLLLASTSSYAEFLMAWGRNDYGQVGDGTTTNRFKPSLVAGISGDISLLGGGLSHSAVVRNGTLYGWGRNNYGQLGVGSNLDSAVPVASTGPQGITALASGYYHNLAIANGGAWAWGFNGQRALGDGTTTNRNVPVAVLGMESGVTSVAAGLTASMAIKDGAVYRWGGSTSSSSASLRQIAGLESGVTAMAMGGQFQVVLQNGAAKGWGNNTSFQLNFPSGTSVSVPTVIPGLESGVTAIATGASHTLAIKNGVVHHYGSLWNDSSISMHWMGEIPATASLDISQIAAGYNCSFALSSDGSFYTWGDNQYGVLGADVIEHQFVAPVDDPNELPSNVLPIQRVLPPHGFKYTQITAALVGYHALATVDYRTLAGDVNLDSVVDFDDLLPLAQNYGTAADATWAQGDFDLNGTVDFTDLLILAQNYSASAQWTPALPAAFAAEWSRALSLVPEPASFAGLGACLAFARRSRCR